MTLLDPKRVAPVKAASKDAALDNWLIVWNAGYSDEDDGDWAVTTDGVRASELADRYDFPADAKSDAEFIAELINAYRDGRLVPA